MPTTSGPNISGPNISRPEGTDLAPPLPSAVRGPLPPPPPPGGPATNRAARRAVIALFAVLATMAIAWGVLTVVDVVSQSTHRDELTFPTTGKVEIRTDGTVTVRSGDVSQITVTRVVTRGLRAPSYDTAVEQGRLLLTGSCPGIISSRCSVSYTVTAPRATALLVRSDAGDVNVTGIDGNVDLESSAGDVRVDDVGGALQLHSSAGDVQATAVHSSQVSASTSAGAVRLAFTTAPQSVSATSSAGDVEVNVPRDEAAYRVDAHTSAGSTSVDVHVDSTTARTITAVSSAGDVRVRYAP